MAASKTCQNCETEASRSTREAGMLVSRPLMWFCQLLPSCNTQQTQHCFNTSAFALCILLYRSWQTRWQRGVASLTKAWSLQEGKVNRSTVMHDGRREESNKTAGGVWNTFDLLSISSCLLIHRAGFATGLLGRFSLNSVTVSALWCSSNILKWSQYLPAG